MSEDSSTSSTPVILGMMNWPVSGVRSLCAKPALTQYVGVDDMNLFNLFDPVYTGEVKGTKEEKKSAGTCIKFSRAVSLRSGSTVFYSMHYCVKKL